jgi:hypothetical protein
MVAYSHLRRRGGRAGHGPEIPSDVRCLGGDSYPRGAVVGAVINVDGVAAGVLSAPVDVLVLPDRPRFSAVRPEERDIRRGLSTARRSARLRYSEEIEVVSAGGQRVAIRIGQIGVEEEASDSPLVKLLPAQLPDPKRLPGGFVTFHAVHGDERPLEGAQGIVPRHAVCSWKTRVRARDLTRL